MPNTAYILEDAGFDRKQVEALTEFMSGSVATKEDIAHLEGKIDTTAMQLRGELKIDIERLESKIEAQGAHLEGKIEAQGVYLESKIETTATQLRGELKADIATIRTELLYIRWIGAAILAGIFIPLIKDLLA